jgi:hypothetical protein
MPKYTVEATRDHPRRPNAAKVRTRGYFRSPSFAGTPPRRDPAAARASASALRRRKFSRKAAAKRLSRLIDLSDFASLSPTLLMTIDYPPRSRHGKSASPCISALACGSFCRAQGGLSRPALSLLP